MTRTRASSKTAVGSELEGNSKQKVGYGKGKFRTLELIGHKGDPGRSWRVTCAFKVELTLFRTIP